MSPEPDFLPTEIADLPLLRIASDLSVMAWEQMTAWRGSLGASLDETVVDTKSSPNDLVTLADAQIESLVRGFLAVVRPNDLMVGEEGAAALDPVEFFPEEFLAELSCFDRGTGRLVVQSEPDSRLEWHVDPIDGTVNYVRGIEHHAFSVGVCLPVPDGSHEAGGQAAGGEKARPDRRRWLFGLVASPGLNATWLGAEGLGSYRVEGLVAAGSDTLPAQRLHGTPAGLSGRLLATGFAYTGSNRGPQLAKLENLMDGYDDIRRCGAASVDLCMVAEGKVNSYAERGLGIYDYAGGAIIAEEAGIKVLRGGGGGPTAAAATQAEVERLIAAI
jgi:myo-inositol-1(or 4)-monophosphatase